MFLTLIAKSKNYLIQERKSYDLFKRRYISPTNNHRLGTGDGCPSSIIR
jgi:hypothetical protein